MTLMEVLIAIFVMGVGLLSVMAMFPMGAVSMARAIKDDRSGHAAANAKAIGIAQNVRFDPAVTPFFTNPQPGQNNFANAPPDGPSYPVFVDPVGNLSYSPGFKSSVAGNTGIARVLPSFATNSASMLKWCTLLDDITFGPDGKPFLASGFVDRGGGFSWGWMLQRPKAGNASVCNMSVLVYNQRPLSAAGLLSGKEVAYVKSCYAGGLNPDAAPDGHLLMLTWPPSLPQPRVSEGSWIMDATPKHNNIPGNTKPLPCSATFHRVVSVGDVVNSSPVFPLTNRAMQIELAQPLSNDFVPAGSARTIVTMDGVAEVMDCGPGWKAGGN